MLSYIYHTYMVYIYGVICYFAWFPFIRHDFHSFIHSSSSSSSSCLLLLFRILLWHGSTWVLRCLLRSRFIFLPFISHFAASFSHSARSPPKIAMYIFARHKTRAHARQGVVLSFVNACLPNTFAHFFIIIISIIVVKYMEAKVCWFFIEHQIIRHPISFFLFCWFFLSNHYYYYNYYPYSWCVYGFGIIPFRRCMWPIKEKYLYCVASKKKNTYGFPNVRVCNVYLYGLYSKSFPLSDSTINTRVHLWWAKKRKKTDFWLIWRRKIHKMWIFTWAS